MQQESGNDAARSRAAARALLERSFAVYLVFVALLAVLLAVGLLAGPEPPVISDPEKAKSYPAMMRMLLVLLFFAATIINLGVQWAARILAARRYRRLDAYPAARTVVAAQWVTFAVYGLFVGLALYYRLRVGGERVVFAAAVAGAALASLYFLKVPRYLLTGVYVSGPEQEGGRPGGPGEDAGEGPGGAAC